MFGTQAVRLLREAWGGIINPDAQGVLRERGAQQLAEELYSMFDDGIPLTQNAPLTLNQQNPNAPALQINNTFGGDSLTIDGGNFNFGGTGSLTINGNGPISIGGPAGINIPAAGPIPPLPPFPSEPGFQPFPPLTEPGATNVNEQLPQLPTTNGITIGNPSTPVTIRGIPFPEGIVAAGTTNVFLGRVQSGSGNTYTVQLYGNGSGQAATALVVATVPQIDSGETIPPGTWLAAVHEFLNGDTLTYEFQPPVWMSG